MSPEQSSLRQRAAALQFKAQTGKLAVAAARDLSVVLPRDLAAAISAKAESGALLASFKASVERAQEENPDDLDDAYERALAALLAEVVEDARRISRDYATKTEAERARVEGVAAGIIEALAVASPKAASDT